MSDKEAVLSNSPLRRQPWNKGKRISHIALATEGRLRKVISSPGSILTRGGGTASNALSETNGMLQR